MGNYRPGGGNYKSSVVSTIVKKADETVTSSVTVQDDNELKLDVKANKSYFGYLMLFINSHATPGFKMTFKAITGASLLRYGKGQATTFQPYVIFATNKTGTTDETEQYIMIPFTFKMGSTPGVLQFQWAQATSDANDTIVRTGSSMVLFEG